MKTIRQFLVLAAMGLLIISSSSLHAAERVTSDDVTFEKPKPVEAPPAKKATPEKPPAAKVPTAKAGPAPAPSPVSATQDYDICLELLADAPSAALDYAQSWAETTEGESIAALHCKALALAALGRHKEAATALSAVALGLDDAPKADRAEAFAQAAAAWLIVDNTDRAEAAIDQALALDPIVSHLMGRAAIRAAKQDWPGVRSDASKVLAEMPTSPDALALRATAMRNLGEPQVALEDANRAVEIAPHHLGALLERGRSRAATFDIAGARADWKLVIAYATNMGRADDPRAEAARDYLKVGEAE